MAIKLTNIVKCTILHLGLDGYDAAVLKKCSNLVWVGVNNEEATHVRPGTHGKLCNSVLM